MSNGNLRRSGILLFISLALCLVSAIGASLLQSFGGKVKVTDLKLETDQGTLSLVMFRPDTATVETPAPAVVASHGMFNSKEMQDEVCVELARRGIVVIAMDMFAHGLSDNADSPRYVANHEGLYYNAEENSFVDTKDKATAFNTHGMIETVEYVWHNLNFVDRERIGVTGHSMGGVNSTLTTRYYHYQSTVGDGIKKVSAALFQACNEATLPGELEGVHVGYVNGLYDEMFSLPLPAFKAMGINTVPELNQFQADTFVQTHAGYTGSYNMGTVVYDKDGMVRVYHAIPADHPLIHFSIPATERIVNFFTEAFKANTNLPATNQVWWIKEGFNALGLVGFFLFILEFIALMLDVPFFKPLKAAEETLEGVKLDKPETTRDYAVYYGSIIFLAALPGLLYYPFMNLGWLKKSAMFPQSMTNNQAVWVSLIGLILIVFIAIANFTFMKHKSYTLQNYGLKIRNDGETVVQGFIKALKTVLLAVAAIACGYLIVFILFGIFKADFRIFSLAVKTFNPDRIAICLQYLLFFLVWSFGLALAVNTNFRKGMSEWRVLAITAVANMLGVSIGLFTYYIPFVANGVPPSSEFINPILLMPIPVIVAAATIYARRVYRQTGNVYLASILNAVLICMITVVNTHIAHPYWFI